PALRREQGPGADHPRRRARLPADPGRRAARPRHPGRPRGSLLPHLARGGDRRLGHRGLRAAHLPHRREAARGRPLRRAAPPARGGPAMSGAQLVLAQLVAAPSPSDGEEFNSVTVSPGLPGFFAMFALAVVVVLLAIDMTRRTRRVQARARVQERKEAEERAAAEHGSEDGGVGADAETEDPAEESSLEETPVEDASEKDDDGGDGSR